MQGLIGSPPGTGGIPPPPGYAARMAEETGRWVRIRCDLRAELADAGRQVPHPAVISVLELYDRARPEDWIAQLVAVNCDSATNYGVCRDFQPQKALGDSPHSRRICRGVNIFTSLHSSGLWRGYAELDEFRWDPEERNWLRSSDSICGEASCVTAIDGTQHLGIENTVVSLAPPSGERALAVAASASAPTVSVVIPTLNEARNLPHVFSHHPP